MARTAGQMIKKGPNKWLVRVYLGRDTNGKRRYHGHTVRGTRKDAQRYLTKVNRDLDLGQFVEPSDRPVREYLADWLKTSATARVTAKTVSDYAALIRLHLDPVIGDRQLGQLSGPEIQGVYNGMTERGLSARTVRYTHSVLHSALEQAVKWGLLARNPTKHIDLPRITTREMQVLSQEQLMLFLYAARDDRWYPLWEILASTGLRPAEALGLKWSDIDGGRIRIQRSLVRHSDGTWVLKEPKTPRARRTVTIPATVQSTLQGHRRQQLEGRLKAGHAFSDNDLVFSVSTGNPLDWRLVVQRHFNRVIKSVDIPRIRPYDLRHTHATLLLAAGENVKVISERLGHASAAHTLDVYSHVLPDMQQETADRVETLLFG